MATRNASSPRWLPGWLTRSPEDANAHWFGLLAPWDWRWSDLVKGRVSPSPPSRFYYLSLDLAPRLLEAGCSLSRLVVSSPGLGQDEANTVDHSIGTRHSIRLHIRPSTLRHSCESHANGKPRSRPTDPYRGTCRKSPAFEWTITRRFCENLPPLIPHNFLSTGPIQSKKSQLVSIKTV